jgi:integration host factor subunit beta
VTKKEIVKTISEEIGLTQLKTKEIVQKTFDAIVETLVGEGRIELRNFGVFEVKKRAARKARNPRTGDRVDVPEKFVVTFKPGKEMEEKVRQLEEREHARRMQEQADQARAAQDHAESRSDSNGNAGANLDSGANPGSTPPAPTNTYNPPGGYEVNQRSEG